MWFQLCQQTNNNNNNNNSWAVPTKWIAELSMPTRPTDARHVSMWLTHALHHCYVSLPHGESSKQSQSSLKKCRSVPVNAIINAAVYFLAAQHPNNRRSHSHNDSESICPSALLRKKLKIKLFHPVPTQPACPTTDQWSPAPGKAGTTVPIFRRLVN